MPSGDLPEGALERARVERALRAQREDGAVARLVPLGEKKRLLLR